MNPYGLESTTFLRSVSRAYQICYSYAIHVAMVRIKPMGTQRYIDAGFVDVYIAQEYSVDAGWSASRSGDQS